MRISIFLYAAIGVCLIVFGCVLENPPADYAPAMFVAVGSLNLFSALAGFWVGSVVASWSARLHGVLACCGHCRQEYVVV